MFKTVGIVLFDKLMQLDNYDHLSEVDQYKISLMKKNLEEAIYRYAIHEWKTWAAKMATEKADNLEEPIWNCMKITKEFIELYATEILPEKIIRFYEAYIYNNVSYRNTWKWARKEYGGLNNDLYYIM